MRLALVIACTALAACAGRAGRAGRVGEAAADSAAAALEGTSITVDNRSWLDVVVYALSDGTRLRLGMVSAAASGTFALPRQALRAGTDLRFLADPVGDRPFTTERVLLQPGQHVHLTLESELARSSLLVR